MNTSHIMVCWLLAVYVITPTPTFTFNSNHLLRHEGYERANQHCNCSDSWEAHFRFQWLEKFYTLEFILYLHLMINLMLSVNLVVPTCNGNCITFHTEFLQLHFQMYFEALVHFLLSYHGNFLWICRLNCYLCKLLAFLVVRLQTKPEKIPVLMLS